MAKTNTRKATASKSILTKEVKEAIATGNRRVLNKSLYRLYLAKVNPDYKIGDKKQHESWYAWISGVLDGSIDISKIEALPDKKAKATKKSTTKAAKSTKSASKSATAPASSDDVREKLIADYTAGSITAEQFASAIVALS